MVWIQAIYLEIDFKLLLFHTHYLPNPQIIIYHIRQHLKPGIQRQMNYF